MIINIYHIKEISHLNTSCVNCQNEIDGHLFCPHCGLAQKCLECDTEFEANEKFCGSCGTERKGPNTSSTETTTAEPTAPKDPAISETKEVQSKLDNVQPTQTQAGQAPTPQQPSKFNISSPLAKLGIGVAVVIVLLFIFDPFSFSTEKRVKKTVNNYFTALDNSDADLLEQTIHPRAAEMEYYDDFAEFFKDLAYELLDETDIELLEIIDVDIDDKSGEAEVTTFVSFAMKGSSEEYRDEAIFELKRIGKDWYIYDSY